MSASLPKYVLEKYKGIADVFIETGTSGGDSTQTAVDLGFKRILSTDNSEAKFNISKQRFADNPVVSLYNLDSTVFLTRIMKSMDEAMVIWLDAHPASGVAETPLMKELDLLKSIRVPMTILIDDARILGKNKWVNASIFDVVSWARHNKIDHLVTFEDNGHARGDIIVIEDPKLFRIRS